MIGILLALLITGCTGNTKHQEAGRAFRHAEPGAPEIRLADLLGDEQGLRDDSEFSVTFPLENPPAIRTMSARSTRSRASASAHSSVRQLKAVALRPSQYDGLIAKLRDLDEREFREADLAGCLEPYSVRVRVRARQVAFQGCRGLGTNATMISKLARHLEYLLLSAGE